MLSGPGVHVLLNLQNIHPTPPGPSLVAANAKKGCSSPPQAITTYRLLAYNAAQFSGDCRSFGEAVMVKYPIMRTSTDDQLRRVPLGSPVKIFGRKVLGRSEGFVDSNRVGGRSIRQR